ncbi:MAG: hypothetical protein CMJ75_14305 [Planctomycetaceae bacterium]|nr:hypothetical protein [Planctomycetaceae bacterium]
MATVGGMNRGGGFRGGTSRCSVVTSVPAQRTCAVAPGIGFVFPARVFRFQDFGTKMICVRPLTLLMSLCLTWFVGMATSFSAAADDEFFERRVRPVLAAHCISCHGARQQKGGLRLDSRAALLRGGDRGVAARPGLPKESLLVQAVTYQGELKMPPDGPLPPDAVAALQRWIQEGAVWPAVDGERLSADSAVRWHWAFQQVRSTVPPREVAGDWSRSPIDRFVQWRQQGRGLQPSQHAEPRTLVRRLSFDLLGLPPTPAQVEDLVNDPRPDRLSRLVDRWLASPQYGERWARHWLDVARYADNKGYVFFEDQSFPWAYTYRDYVVDAFNRDLPYDQFVRQQLAADQLDLGSDRRPLTAMGFLTLGGHFMNNIHDIVDDRIDVVTRGLLGLTVTCSRCHDHKYDPISQADYYSLYGVFRSSYEPTTPPLFEPPPQTAEYEKFKAEMESRDQQLREFVERKHRDLVTTTRQRMDEYLIAVHKTRGQPPTDNFMLLTDTGAINPAMLLRWQSYLGKTIQHAHPVWHPWQALSELPEAEFSSAAAALLAGWRGAPGGTSVNPLVLAVLAPTPASMEGVARSYGRLFKQINEQWQNELEQAMAAERPLPAALPEPHAEQVRHELYGKHSPVMVPPIFGWGFITLFPDRGTQGEYKKRLKAVEEWSRKGEGAPPRAMVLLDRERPFQPRIFQRGNPHRVGKPVPRRFLEFLAPDGQTFKQGSGRKELAEAIVAKSNPLTARVLVNRMWQHHFGQGLVTTASDFGTRSTPPSHPELLDFLATQFVRGGWSIKRLHRQILSSATYLQASDDRPAAAQLDPENRLLWKMNRRRLGFEATRDSLIAVSSGLDLRMGGPAIELLKPGFVPRRTLYGFINRMDVDPLLTTFDFPNPAATSGQRETTTVAPQSLYLMNNAFVEEVARRLVQRVEVVDASLIKERLQRLYALLFSRAASSQEIQLAEEFLGEDVSLEQWTRYAQALLMGNEFVFLD